MIEEEEKTKRKKAPLPKRATAVLLSEKEQEGLLQIIRRHRSEQQMVMSARIVLLVAQGFSNAHIGRELGVHVDTVRLWRDRWVGLQGIEPRDVEPGRGAARCSTLWGEAEVQQRPGLSGGGAGM